MSGGQLPGSVLAVFLFVFFNSQSMSVADGFFFSSNDPPIQPSRMNEVIRGHCSFGNCSALYAGRNYGSPVLLIRLGRNLCQSICTWFSLGASYHNEPSHELIPWNRGILLKLCIRLKSYVMEVNETFQLRVG